MSGGTLAFSVVRPDLPFSDQPLALLSPGVLPLEAEGRARGYGTMI